MTDNDDILPFDGGNTPDDAEMSARVAASYASTDAATPEMIERCVRAVRRRVMTPAATIGGPAKRNWIAAAVAVAAIFIVSLTMRSSTNKSGSDTADSIEPIGTVTPVDNGAAFLFKLSFPKGTAKVSVVGDFNGWDTAATPMTQSSKEGAWSAKITLLPGRHVYAYIVNGEKWTIDPLAPQVPDAGFGATNAFVVDGEPRGDSK
ncbi:MAG: isoamylase early set domain-containing protein [Gemmatimonadaceae bacterium]